LEKETSVTTGGKEEMGKTGMEPRRPGTYSQKKTGKKKDVQNWGDHVLMAGTMVLERHGGETGDEKKSQGDNKQEENHGQAVGEKTSTL